MSAEQVIGLILTLLVMTVGLAGSILPGVPSTPLVLLAAIGHKLYFGPASTDWWLIGLLAVCMLLSIGMDYLASMYGAKKLGATWRGVVGCVVGVLIGLFFSFPGILVGPFIGALLFEMAGGRNLKESSKAGLGALLGLLAGALGKLACCVAMMGLFTVNVIYRSLQQ
jgi:uncharacterized protein